MDQVKANKIHAEFQAMMAEFAKKHGMTAACRGSFTDATMKISVQFADLAATGGEAFDPTLVAHLRKWGRLTWGLTVEMLGTEFMSDRGVMIFHGTRGTSTKYLIAKVKSTGVLYRYPLNEVTGKNFVARIIATHTANTAS
jgi:hypothetical protein